MIHNPHKLLRSGGVKRWHQYPEMNGCGENLAEHQWSVAILVLMIAPDARRELLIAALTHDAGELDVGDLAYTSTPDVGLAAAEGKARAALIDYPELEPEEVIVLHVADRLSSWIKMMTFAPWLAERDGWPEMMQEVLRCVEDHLHIASYTRVKRLMAEYQR